MIKGRLPAATSVCLDHGGTFARARLDELGAQLEPEGWSGSGVGAGTELPDVGGTSLAAQAGIHPTSAKKEVEVGTGAYFCLLLCGEP